jgi:hypothetical protein
MAVSAMASGAFARATGGGGMFVGPLQETAVNQGIPIGQVNPTESVLYSNVPQGAETVFSSGSSPRTGGADEAIFDGPGALLTSMQFGYSVGATGPAAFDVRVRLYDDIDLVTASGPQFLNLVKDFTVPFSGQTAGAFITTPITIPGGGASVTANGATLGSNFADVYVQLDFYVSGTQTHVASNGVTYIFDGTGVNVGRTLADPLFGGDATAASEVYWRDANDNQIITADEARNFAAPNLANFVLQFEGSVVPEPASMSLVATGTALLGVRRRRK